MLRRVKKLAAGQFVRFLVVGLSNTLISYSVFLLLFHALDQASAPAAIAQIASYASGTVWSYYWNRIWTFKSKTSVLHEAPAFFVSQLVLLFISSAGLGLLVDYFGLPPTASWLAVMAFVTILNFVVLQKLVYKRRADDQSSPLA
jgi:putative flippase GtrA